LIARQSRRASGKEPLGQCFDLFALHGATPPLCSEDDI
jgi:hypothetical protein